MRAIKGDIDRAKHDDDYAEHVIGGAHVYRTRAGPSERSTIDDRPTKRRSKAAR